MNKPDNHPDAPQPAAQPQTLAQPTGVDLWGFAEMAGKCLLSLRVYQSETVVCKSGYPSKSPEELGKILMPKLQHQKCRLNWLGLGHR